MKANIHAKIWLFLSFVLATNVTTYAVPTPVIGITNFTSDDAFLNYVEQQTFNYFWNEANPSTGLVPDKSQSGSACSIACVGFGLSSINIAVERGWITRSAGAARVMTTLQTLYNAPKGSGASGYAGYNGWFYHYLSMTTGLRNGTSELSTIDTSLLMLGVIDAGLFFNSTTDTNEIQIQQLSSNLVNNVNWQWAKRSDNLVYMQWTPEAGFTNISGWSGGNEAYLIYLVGLGASVSPLPTASWTAWTSTYNWQTKYGYSYIFKAPLFIHQYVHCWFNLNGVADAYMQGKSSDYFQDACRASLAQQAYAIANPLGFTNYNSVEWGLTACSGPPELGYVARGCPSGTDDGVMAPTAALSAIPFVPQIAIPTAYNFYNKYTNLIWTTEGFRDSYIIQRSPPWFCGWADGIDQGPILIMIENYRSGSTWRRMLSSPIVQQGLQRAGFTAPPPEQLSSTLFSPTQVNLAWHDNSTFETGFQVEFSTNAVNFITNSTLAAGVTNTLISIMTGTTYYFRVRTTSAAGNSGFRETNVFFGTVSGAPTTPSNVVAAAVSSSQINVTWLPSLGATGYVVNRNGSPIAMLTGTNYSDTGLASGTTYYYTVNSTNTFGSSPLSMTAAATTSAQFIQLAEYTFEGSPTDPIIDTNNFDTELNPTVVASGISAGSISQGGDGSTVGYTTANLGYVTDPVLRIFPGCTNNNSSGVGGTALTNGSAAVAANSFFTFTLTANTGSLLNLSSLEFDAAKGGATTPRGFVIQSSADNFAANLAGPTDISSLRPTITHYSTDLTGASFQGIHKISFRLFTYSPSVGSTVEYDNIAVNGMVGQVPTPIFNSVQLIGNQVVFSGTNGTANDTYYELGTTNISLPMSQWTSIQTNSFDSGGKFGFTNQINPSTSQTFFRLRMP